MADVKVSALPSATPGLTDLAMIVASGVSSKSTVTSLVPAASINAAKLATDAVETAKIKDANVTTAKIAALNITTPLLADDAVDETKLADSAVSTDKIVNANVTTVKIADANVTKAKLENITTSKLLGRGDGATGVPQEITLGSNLSMSGTTLNATDTDTGMTQLTGDVTAGPGNGSQVATIGNDKVVTAKILDANVTYAKIQSTSAADRLLGRGQGGGAGVLQEISLGTNLALTGTVLNTVGGTASGVQNGYRLSLTTAVPVTTADVASAGTIYWVPYKGKSCPLYTGAGWIEYVGGQLSLALTGLLTSGSVYDVFVNYNSGTPVLTVLVWTNTTTRATALAYQDGWLVKSGTPTHFYVGTLRASGTDITEDSGGGVTTQVGGKRYLYNYYNRVRRAMSVFDSTDTWATANSTRQANSNAGNQVDFVIGVSEDALEVEVAVEGIPAATTAMASAIGIDSTTTPSGYRGGFATVASRCNFTATYRGLVGIGHHTAVWLEIANTTSGTWVGDAAATRVQSGLNASIWA